MAVFQSPASALQAAIEMQQRVGVLPPVSGMKMSIRVGLAYGPTNIQGTEITGDAAKVAAWLAGIAQPNDILTDACSLSAIPQPLRDLMQDRGLATHIGRMDGVHLYAYSSTPVQSRPPAPLSKKAAVLILSHGGSAIRFSGESQALTIGRESTCDMVIKTPKVSRLHAKIELRDHRFVLVDESTNGTFIKIGKEPEIRIHHEPFVLRGKGQLSFASSTHEPQADLLSFEVSESV